jgi:hypothetical protein
VAQARTGLGVSLRVRIAGLCRADGMALRRADTVQGVFKRVLRDAELPHPSEVDDPYAKATHLKAGNLDRTGRLERADRGLTLR